MNQLPIKKQFIALSASFLIGISGYCQIGETHIQQAPEIAQLIKLQSEMTEDNAFGERYKIQIFYGNNSEATEVLKKFQDEYPAWFTTIEYQAPNYKVWIGDFRTRLEADRAFIQIKDDYKSAFVFRPNRK